MMTEPIISEDANDEPITDDDGLGIPPPVPFDPKDVDETEEPA